jgi:hypothetical protein
MHLAGDRAALAAYHRGERRAELRGTAAVRELASCSGPHCSIKSCIHKPDGVPGPSEADIVSSRQLKDANDPNGHGARRMRA